MNYILSNHHTLYQISYLFIPVPPYPSLIEIRLVFDKRNMIVFSGKGHTAVIQKESCRLYRFLENF